MTPLLVAIVPAAGLSRRMGQPKLLLDLAGRTVMARVIEALHDAGIARCLVVVRSDDQTLIQEVTAAGGEVVLPATDPPDMRQSVQWALRAVGGRESGVGWSSCPVEVPRSFCSLSPTIGVTVGENSNVGERVGVRGPSQAPLWLPTPDSRPPTPCDGWVLIPADHPTLNATLVRELIAAWSASPSQIAVPVYEGQRGHPTIFPWSLAEEVFRLPPEQGLNSVLRSDPERVREVIVSDPRVLDDLDTPEDLLRLRQELEHRT